jgi:hypothetical protein
VNGEVCKEKGKKLWKERKKDLTPPALLEMDGYGVNQEVAEDVQEAVREGNRSSWQFQVPGLCRGVLHPSSPAHREGHLVDSVPPNLFPILRFAQKTGQ